MKPKQAKKLEKKKVAEKKSATKNKKKKRVYTKEEIIRKKRKIKATFIFILIILVLTGIGVTLCKAEIFNIKDIKVVGNEQVMQEELQLQDKLGKNIFLLSKGKIERDIKQNQYVKDVKIKKIIPNKLEITIEERQKTFMIKLEDGYLYLDNQGYIIEKTEINLQKPIIAGYETKDLEPGNRLNEKDLEKLEDVLKIVENCKKIEIYDKITSINILDKEEYIVYIEEMKKLIYLGNSNNLANKMLYIKDILQRENGKEGKIFVNGDFSEGFQSYFREEPNQVPM